MLVPRNLCLIPAKANSIRFPGKNTALFRGIPLFVHAVDIAIKSGLFDYVVVSSEDPEILGTAMMVGAEAMARPAELARNPAEVIEVTHHALSVFVNNGYKLDDVCILLPTSPLRTVEDVRASYQLLMRQPVDVVMSVVPFTEHKLYALERARDNTMTPVPVGTLGANPQGLFQHDGTVLWARAKHLRSAGGNYYRLAPIAPYFIDQDRALEIHYPEDLQKAEEAS